MFYTYVLKSQKDGKLYIGFTSDLRKRFNQHNRGYVTATRPRVPFDLIFYEAYLNKYDALRREKYLKTDKGKTTLRSMLRDFLPKIKIQAWSRNPSKSASHSRPGQQFQDMTVRIQGVNAAPATAAIQFHIL